VQNATATSRCFMGTIVNTSYSSSYSVSTERAACFESHCLQNTDLTYNLTLTIGGNVIQCPQAGGNVTAPAGYMGIIVCPPSVVACAVYQCHNNCNGNGVCTDGACVCANSSLNAWDCSVISTTPNNTNNTNTTNSTNNTNNTGGGSGTGTGSSGSGGNSGGSGGSTPSCNPATTCSSHGNCTSSGGCACTDGWAGSDCSSEALVLNCTRCNSVLDCEGNVCTCTPIPGRNCTAAQLLYNKKSGRALELAITSILLAFSIFL